MTWDDDNWNKKKNNNEGDFGFTEPNNNDNNLFRMKTPSNFTQIGLIIFTISAFWLASGFFILKEEEEALVLRFGKYARIAKPGANYHFPYPFETIIKQKVTRIENEEIGFRSVAFGEQKIQSIPEESLMLTSDENIVELNFVVQWKIQDIKDYVFNVYGNKDTSEGEKENRRDFLSKQSRNVTLLKQSNTVKNAAESAMREVIGNTLLKDAQTEGRAKVERQAKELLQYILDSYGAGIKIYSLQLRKVDPPSEVIDSFRDVQTARLDKERLINQAGAYKNDILPRARGEAQRIILDAEAYKERLLAKAKGESERFITRYKEYAKAEDVTKRRIYLDTMENFFKNSNKIIIDDKISGNLTPYLPLNELRKKDKN